MPASYTSARFVGREVAFARLAAVLDDAASGRSRTLILGGTAGIGISRFLDEGVTRVAELSEPWTILRGGSWPCGADDPVCPGRPGDRPGPARAGRCGPRDRPRSGRPRRHPPPARPRDPRSAEPSRASASAPERRQARTLEAILGMLGRLGERRPVALDPRGPAPGRRRDPGARPLPVADRTRPAPRDHRVGPARHRAARRPVVERPRRHRRRARVRSSG